MKRLPQNNDLSKKPLELLAPAGSPEAGYAALHYGADAVYLGLENFSARAAARNFSSPELADIVGYAHSLQRPRKIYAALNTLVLEKEIPAIVDLLAEISAIGVDAVIVQDFGILKILREYFPKLKVHASTQMAIHNRYGVETAVAMGLQRATLARELSLTEVSEIAAKKEIETEVFIHGALCYSYSGLCLFSSHLYGRSGNRGRCAYPCREWFRTDASSRAAACPSALLRVLSLSKGGAPSFPDQTGRPPQAEALHSGGRSGGFIFSMKDLALGEYVSELRKAGVTALKIEGRMKSPLYVAATVNYYRKLIDGKLGQDEARRLAEELKTIFSRPWTELYLRGRKIRNVIDREIVGHRGSPTGSVEGIVKYAAAHCLRFRTDLPLELHDGLQIDVKGLQKPFGFSVKNIFIREGRGHEKSRRVFAAPAGSCVEIPLPGDHPHIPLDAVIYSSSSQKVKRDYDFFRPKVGQFRARQTADFEIRIEPTGFEIFAVTEVSTCVKVQKRFDSSLQPAHDSLQVAETIEETFRKLGNTNLRFGRIKIDNSSNLFVPVSLLNAARRDITMALEQKIAEIPRQYAAKIKNEMAKKEMSLTEATESGKINTDMKGKADSFSVLSVSGNLIKWSIKTDQPQALADCQPDDFKDVDEVILELVPENCSSFGKDLDLLAGKTGKSRLRLSLPIIMREWDVFNLTKPVTELTAKGWHKWQISNLWGWSFLRSIYMNSGLDISADWPIYTLNNLAISEVQSLGIKKITLSPEDGIENMSLLLREHASDATVIVYQDTPLMISENCVFASEKCAGSRVCHFGKSLFALPDGNKIRIERRGCRSFVLNERSFCLAEHLDFLARSGAVSLRADFMYRRYSPAEALDVWRCLRTDGRSGRISAAHCANFRRGLA